jgi:hypothetical protein
MTAPVRSPPPIRDQAGATTDWPFGPLADSAYGNPAFYHQFYDDFDNSLGAAGLWTVSTNNGGTVANTPGDGGLALFTTGAVSTNYAAIQLPSANFTLPQGVNVSLGKKLFFLARLQASDMTNSALIAGMCNTTATVFTGGSITDGIYFTKPSGGTTLNIITASGGVLSTWTIPTSAYALANATNIDLGFYIDYYSNLNVFVASQLYGFIPQSGSGAVIAASGVTVLPNRGRVLQVTGVNWNLGPASPTGAPWTVSAVNLNPTLGIQTSAAAIKTMTADFIGVQKER